MFWSTQRVGAEQQARNLIQPFLNNRVQQGAYELSLSDQALTTPVKISEPNGVADGVLIIEPGQFGLLYSAETVHIPDDVIAFISIKASIKFKGVVNVSGFHVDPGYQGRLKFSVYNAGTETVGLGVGQPAFLIWFADLDQPTVDPYSAPHQHVGQEGLTLEDRLRMRKIVPSPAALDKRLNVLEDRWRILVAAGLYFVLPILAAIVAGIVVWVLTTIVPRHSKLDDTPRQSNEAQRKSTVETPAPNQPNTVNRPTFQQTTIIAPDAITTPSATIDPTPRPST